MLVQNRGRLNLVLVRGREVSVSGDSTARSVWISLDQSGVNGSVFCASEQVKLTQQSQCELTHVLLSTDTQRTRLHNKVYTCTYMLYVFSLRSPDVSSAGWVSPCSECPDGDKWPAELFVCCFTGSTGLHWPLPLDLWTFTTSESPQGDSTQQGRPAALFIIVVVIIVAVLSWRLDSSSWRPHRTLS